MTKQNKSKSITDNVDNVVLLLTMWIGQLTWCVEHNKGKKDLRPMFLKIRDLFDEGKITNEDLLALNKEKIVDIGDYIELSTYLRKNDEGLYEYEAIDIGHKYQFMLLSVAQIEKLDVMGIFRDSMPIMEKIIDDIMACTYDKKKMTLLQSLPAIEEWDHDIAHKMYQTFKTFTGEYQIK